ncbi:MAG: zf-HC2 domain-containing protein [Deltaproteobacteria bacterium]|nr:zf-HC2 domain-containing protein [Deltaproteobacteria bacterium]
MHDDCKKYFERISEYLDGELDASICEKINQHLQECPECRNCLESLKKTVDICKKLPPETIPEDVQARIREHLRHLLEKQASE